MNEVTVRVPATTANPGPGDDALGVSGSTICCVTVERAAAFTNNNGAEITK